MISFPFPPKGYEELLILQYIYHNMHKLLCISEINPQVGCYTPIPNLNVKSFNSNCLSQLTGAPENAAWMVTFSPPLSVYRIAENYFFL